MPGFFIAIKGLSLNTSIDSSSLMLTIRVSDPIFKNNRTGFRNPKPTRNIGRFCEQLLPVKRVLDYHLSLNRFINKNRVRGLINRATFEMSEDSLWHRIMKINGDKLSKNSALIEKIFQGTRFYGWITNAANMSKNDTID